MKRPNAFHVLFTLAGWLVLSSGMLWQSAVAQISNSPFTQALQLTGTAGSASISSVGSTNTFFAAQAGNHGTTIGTLSAMVTSGSTSGIVFTLASSGSCTGADNASFATAGTNGQTLEVGGSDVTAVQTYSICVKATDASFTNSPFFQAITLTGTGVGAVVTTATYTNYSGATLAAGTPVSFGQAFRYGDIMPGSHPVIRDASTHTPLAGQQWDELSTWQGSPFSAAPNGTPLITAAGTWTWGSAVTGRPGEYNIQLNGSATGAVGLSMEVANGQVYVNTASFGWFVWNGSTFSGGAVSPNGSWRHAVWGAWLPSSVANGASFQVEYVTTSGGYSETSHQALSALCSGPAAHDLKIHLTDVRNQNDTVRDSGDATFRVCDNIANTGRDAPRHLRDGNVYDEYEVRGMFVYATSGHKDPLLYAQCPIDIFTKSSDGVSPGDVRWVCHIHNSWENVASGSVGNAGNPGPAGFANDPQAISYRAEIDDGATDVLDWSGLDATLDSASNPVVQTNCGVNGPNCLFVPSSTGANAGYYGQATRVSCAATCLGGLTNGQLYYLFPASSQATSGTETRYMAPQLTPSGNEAGSSGFMTASQGTCTTTFSTRFQHYHWEAWQTLDTTGQDNWSPFGTTARVTRKVYPAFTAAEKLYWEQTGSIIPLNLSQAPSSKTDPPWSVGGSLNYEPFGRLNVIGGTAGATRADLGISNEYSAAAFLSGTERAWDLAKLFTLGSSIHGYVTLLNEATGRIPVLNNGPPAGLGGNGSGGSYADLGAPQNQVELEPYPTFFGGLADVPHNQPNPSYDISGGLFQGGTSLDHVPNFNGFTYAVFGDRPFLDVMQWNGNRDYLWQRTGPGPELGQGYYRDNNATGPDGVVHHYYGLMIDCCQTRGSAWMFRDITYPAAFGGDSNIERAYFNDFLIENRNYYPLWLKWRDGPGSTNYSASVIPPNLSSDARQGVDESIENYVYSAAWLMTAWLHEPLAGTWMSKYQRIFEGLTGGQLPNAPVSYYTINNFFSPAYHNGSGVPSSQGGNVGQFTNGVDGADFAVYAGGNNSQLNVKTGGQLQASGYTLAVGDQLKNMNGLVGTTGIPPLDQLSGTRFYPLLAPIDNTAGTFYVQCNAADHTAFPTQCPTAGAAFTGFTRGGTPVANESGTENGVFQLHTDPGPCQGYSSGGYQQYGGMMINGLNILGYSVPHAIADWNARCGDNGYVPTLGSVNWDRTVVIPGLPPAVNGISVAPTVPAPAAAAGFTKPVVQADFTKPGNFWSTPANYMTNCGAAHSVANQPDTWHFTWSYQFTANELNCNASISVVTDTAVTPNVQILKLQYLVSQFTTGSGGFGNAAALAFPNAGSGVGSNTSWMPNEWYSKSVWRFDAATLAQNTGNETNAQWSTNLFKEGGGCCFFDEDAYELPFYSSGTPPTGCSPTGITCACGQLNEWPGPAGNYSSPWFNTGLICVNKDFTQYHTFEYLATSDESTGVTICQWVDGTFNACASGALNGPGMGNNDYLDRGRSILVQAMNAHAPTSNMTLYLQSFELWSCPNFASGTCPGSTFVNGGSSSPSYWH